MFKVKYFKETLYPQKYFTLNFLLTKYFLLKNFQTTVCISYVFMYLCFLFKFGAENLANKTNLVIVPFDLPYL